MIPSTPPPRFRPSELGPERIREARARLGLTLERFACLLGVGPGTVRNWEAGRKDPDGPARALLVVAVKEPEALTRALRIESQQSGERPGCRAPAAPGEFSLFFGGLGGSAEKRRSGVKGSGLGAPFQAAGLLLPDSR